jgi:hypothetical protein
MYLFRYLIPFENDITELVTSRFIVACTILVGECESIFVFLLKVKKADNTLGTIAWKLDQYEKQVVHVDGSDLATEVWNEIK